MKERLAINEGPDVGPQGFGGSGVKGYLLPGSWEALMIIFRDLGSKQPHGSGDLGAPVQSKNEFKTSHLKGKTYNSFDFFFKFLVYIDGSYLSNTIVNNEYPRSQNGISV